MKLLLGPVSLCLGGLWTASAYPIRHAVIPPRRRAAVAQTVVDLDETAARDASTMEEWCAACGVQRADGFQLTQTIVDAVVDVSVATTQDLVAGSPILFVPSAMILSSDSVRQELGPLEAVEDLFARIYEPGQLAHFYLFVKIMVEYEKGDQSPWYPWLNSLPRRFGNGASMTFFCFECLPPLVSRLALNERTRFSQFFRAVKYVDCLDWETRNYRTLAKWAFAVVYTRCFEVGPGDVRIVPMADMFNHGSDTEVEISYDEQGNCYAYTTCNVPAGYPLRISYTGGDNTNPSKLFARYGFLDESSPATFCKIMIPRPSEEIVNMGYDHSRMLFYKDTGGVSEEVWDVLLYRLLESKDPDVQEVQRTLYLAHMNGDYATKQAIHQQYYPETLAALRKHVDTFLNDLDQLSAKAEGRDLTEHPRLPLILKHNEFVKQTFLTVRAQL